MDPDTPTIYGGFPMPSRAELDEAWIQITDRIESSAQLMELGTDAPELWTQSVNFLVQCSDLTALLTQRSEGIGLPGAERTPGEAYVTGFIEVLEILLTVAMNREARALLAEEIPPMG